jgi:predicted dehydrogenase
MHMPNLRLLDCFHTVSVCDLDSVRCEDVARYLGAAESTTQPQTVLENPDVQLVIISTRHDTHADLAVQALQAGKHVFVEKPMAMNDEQLETLLAAAKASADRMLMVGFNRRFSGYVQQLKKLHAHRVRPLVLNYRVLAGRVPADSWIHGPAGGGRVIGEACHMLDLINYIVGDDVALEEYDVVATPQDTGEMPGDNFIVSLRYADGSVASLTYTTLGKPMKGNGKERIEANWDGKTFVIEDFVEAHASGCSTGMAKRAVGKGHQEEFETLGRCLCDGTGQPISLDACVRATRMSFVVDKICRGQIAEIEHA